MLKPVKCCGDSPDSVGICCRCLLVYCVNSPFTLFVIPGVTRNPVFLGWIPAFAEMTASELM